MSDETYDVIRCVRAFTFIKVQGNMKDEDAYYWIKNRQEVGAFIRIKDYQLRPTDPNWSLYDVRVIRPAGY